MKQKKLKAVGFGLWGETLACQALRLKGYKILKRNHKTPFGEIDIIAKRRQTLCFVEVKSRAKHEDAMHALSLSQQKRIIRAAKSFLSVNQGYCMFDIRFDFIAIAPLQWPKHIENAWLDDT